MDRWLASIFRLVALLIVFGAFHIPALAQEDPWAEPRAEIVHVIQGYGLSLPEAAGPEGPSAAVFDVMRKVVMRVERGQRLAHRRHCLISGRVPGKGLANSVAGPAGAEEHHQE